jgi:hypothetical protein
MHTADLGDEWCPLCTYCVLLFLALNHDSTRVQQAARADICIYCHDTTLVVGDLVLVNGSRVLEVEEIEHPTCRWRSRRLGFGARSVS